MDHFIFILCLFLCACHSSTALGCAGCSPKACKKPVGCKGGIVKDACNCCDTCAKISGEVCGGPFEISGKCGSLLECVKNPKEGENISDSLGTCHPKCGPVCMIFCANGNVLDGKGCPTCGCNNLPKCVPIKDKYPVETSVKAPLCPQIRCLIKCPFGRVLDRSGCNICSCRSLPPLCDKRGCCKQPTKFCNKNNSCCIHDSTCLNRRGWYRN